MISPGLAHGTEDTEVLLAGYFLLDTDKRELVWFGDVERFASMESVAMAHQAARENKGIVVEWYYSGISPLVSDCAPLKKEFSGARGYRDEAVVAHTECCDIRVIQRVKVRSELSNTIFDVLNAGIEDKDTREMASSLFRMGVPLRHDAHGYFAQGFQASFFANGHVKCDVSAPRYSYIELVSNADVYDGKIAIAPNDGAGCSM